MFKTLASLFSSEQKQFRAQPIVSLQTVGQPQWTPRNYAELAREGFAGNAIGYRCVRMIAEAASSVPLLLYQADVELSYHPVLTLLKRPNPAQTGRDLIENIISYLLVAGNSYIEISKLDGVPRELVTLRPDRVKIIGGNNGWPESYEYSVYGESIRLPAENILHIKMFNPLNDYYGQAPLEAAQRSIDTHNSASAWNKAMLDNAARPSGALVFAASEGRLTTEQFERIKPIRGLQMRADRWCWKVGLIGKKWVIAPRTWSLPKPKMLQHATLPWPSVCRLCCLAFRVIIHLQTTPKPIAASGVRRSCHCLAV
jgi:phage portal protein BeeE